MKDCSYFTIFVELDCVLLNKTSVQNWITWVSVFSWGYKEKGGRVILG